MLSDVTSAESTAARESTMGCTCRCRTVCCALLLPSCALIAALLVGLAVTLPMIWPQLEKSMVEERMQLLPGNVPFDQLQLPSLPIYKDVYFFNLTNPDGFQNGEKPRVNETGPYSFNEIRLKHFNEGDLLDNRTLLRYTQTKTFHFNQERSGKGLHEDDVICTINLPLVGAVYMAENMAESLRLAAKIYLRLFVFSETKAKLYVCVPATDLVFHYSDKLVKRLHSDIVLKTMGQNLPLDHISLQQNNSINDTYLSIIHTGVDDPALTGQFVQWDGKERLDLWPGETANDINGTEGLIFKPNIEEGDDLEAFVDDVYRSFPLNYINRTSILGLDVFRYELPATVFQSAYQYPPNARWGSWCPNGLFYLGAVQNPQVPVFGSKPRFMDTDPMYTRSKIDNLLPVDRSQETIAFIHPTIGATLQFQRILQLNMQVNRSTFFPQLKNIDETIYFPVLYLSENSELTPEFVSYLESHGLQELKIANDAVYSLTGFFGLIVVVALLVSVIAGICLCQKRKRLNYTSL